MTLAEALTELRVETGADPETIRRAYLQLIKTRKPEVDPEGFQRARTAYEIARGASELEALATESAQFVSTPAPSTAGGAAAAAPPGDPFAKFLTAWNAVPGSADMNVRLKIARQAVAALPREPRAYWLVASALSGRATDNELAEALRAGWQAGWLEFLEALLLRLPQRATRAEVEAAYASDRLPLRLAAASASARWDSARSAAVIVEICQSAAAASNPRLSETLPMQRILNVILVLHEMGALTDATAAHAALRRFLGDSGLELALARGPLGGVWTLAEELADLPADFPRELRSAFAIATRAGDLRSAFFDACFHVRHRPREVRGWINRLQASAPNVVGILRGAVTREASLKRGQRTQIFSGLFSGFKGWFAIPVLLAVIRAFLPTGDAPTPARMIDPVGDPTVLAQKTALPAGDSPQLAMSRRAAEDLCGTAGPRYGQLICGDIEAGLDSFQEGDCSEIRQRVVSLKRKIYNGHVSELESKLVTNLELAVWQVCYARSPGREDERP